MSQWSEFKSEVGNPSGSSSKGYPPGDRYVTGLRKLSPLNMIYIQAFKEIYKL